MAKVSIFNQGPETIIIAKHQASGVTEVFWPQIILLPNQSIALDVSEIVSVLISVIDIEPVVEEDIPLEIKGIPIEIKPLQKSFDGALSSDKYVWAGTKLIVKRIA